MRGKGVWPSFCLGIGAAWCVFTAGGMLGQALGAWKEEAAEAGWIPEAGSLEEPGGRRKTESSAGEQKTSAAQEPEKKKEKTVALTFDDGPHGKWTPALLDGLRERGVKATFFLMGENIEGKEEIVKRMAAEGHLIGNHSYRHIQLTKAGTDEVCQAIEKTGEMIREVTGEAPQYVRPPYGDWNEDLECRTKLTTVLWDVDSLDWKFQNRDRVADKVCREAEDGDIILMHDIFQSSEEAALDIVDRLLAEGWRFVTVDELMID